MNGDAQLRQPKGRMRPWLGAVLVAVLVPLVAAGVDMAALRRAAAAAADDPAGLATVVAVYGLAFVVRAAAWRRVLPDLTFGHALAALHVALAANHVLPLRLGEPLRATTAARRGGVGLAPAAASTLTLRAADVVAVVLLAVGAGGRVLAGLAGRWTWALVAVATAGAAAGVVWGRRLVRGGARLRTPGPLVAAATVAAWVLEAVVIWQTARWVGIPLAPAEAVAVTAVTVAAQVVAVAPAGFGTYEAAATAAMVALGAPAGGALAAALAAHALKTAYALAGGAVAAFFPAPGLVGRLRLPRCVPARPAIPPVGADAPVVLFLPARDEEAAVAAVVARAPATVGGHRVEVVVVDDGSSDTTAEVAARAGADVVRVEHGRGLGAAVRRGLAEGVRRGAVAVAFCDADGEYDPAELGRLLAPILAGEADYVVGSRFAGRIRRMLPHRRVGNRLLTALLAFVARAPITDGQSGYRALSWGAAAAAEVIHDYNYAQVLTLDLLGKGFRYGEVPISYGFREQGTSFVRLAPYLRAVVPAVYRELNAA